MFVPCPVGWSAASDVAFFRAVEVTLRRKLTHLDAADQARQQADAIERHGRHVLVCEAPRGATPGWDLR